MVLPVDILRDQIVRERYYIKVRPPMGGVSTLWSTALAGGRPAAGVGGGKLASYHEGASLRGSGEARREPGLRRSIPVLVEVCVKVSCCGSVSYRWIQTSPKVVGMLK